MKRTVVGLMLMGLVGCGASGEPLRPTTSANVSVGTGGVSAGTNIGVTNGAFSLNLGQTVRN